MFSRRLGVGLLLLNLALIIAVVALIANRSHKHLDPVSRYPLLSRSVLTSGPNDLIFNLVPLRQSIDTYVQKIPAPYSLSIEYLPSGTTIRSGDDVQLVGASLLKLPVVMNLYKAVELKRLSLDQQVTIKPEWIDTQYGDLYKRGAGAKISLREAAYLALHDSDNTAINVVQENVLGKLKPDEFVLSQLDVETTTEGDRVKISSKAYSSVLKCLYYACFDNRDDSQTILRTLSTALQNNRIAGGVPSYIPVAHKIGTFGDNTQADCGIIYIPNRPTLMCMLIELPEDQADLYMRSIAKATYDYISSQ